MIPGCGQTDFFFFHKKILYLIFRYKVKQRLVTGNVYENSTRKSTLYARNAKDKITKLRRRRGRNSSSITTDTADEKKGRGKNAGAVMERERERELARVGVRAI